MNSLKYVRLFFFTYFCEEKKIDEMFMWLFIFYQISVLIYSHSQKAYCR